MPVLKALKRFTYNKVKLREGDLFKCKGKDVALCISYQLACKPEVVIAPPVPVYQTRHMEANPVARSKTVAELREEAGAKGIFLPSGYIPKAELIRIIAEG
jgi:hypothetical protein